MDECWVFDIVRGKFTCKSGMTMKKVVAVLKKDPRIKCTLNFKNRFKHPTANGYGDYPLHVVFQIGTLAHVCKIQIHLHAVTEFADTHGGHESYEYFRRVFALVHPQTHAVHALVRTTPPVMLVAKGCAVQTR